MGLQSGGALCQAFQRCQEHHQVGEEHDEFAGGNPASQHLCAAVPEQSGTGDGNQELPRHFNGSAPPPREHFLTSQEVKRGAVADAFKLWACKAAHHANAAECFTCR